MKQFLLSFAFISLFYQTTFSASSYFPVATIPTSVVQDTTHTADSVNIGYYYVRRNQLTGAVSTISQKQLQQVAVTSVDQALKGRVASVQVTQNSGMPGAAASVRVRGVSTLYNTAEPLYVIDGVPFTQTKPGENPQFLPVLDFINPEDIASIELLKDAGAVAIYGNRAANGVVLITTRRGQSKSNQVTYNTYFGVQEVPRQIPLLNATEYAILVNKALLQKNAAPRYTTEQILEFGAGTNWQDEIFRVAPVQNHQLSYSGGSAAHRIFASTNYLNQQGVIRESGLQRYSFRLNYDGQISKKLKVGISSLHSTLNNQPAYQLITLEALTAAPVFKPGEPAGKFMSPLQTLKDRRQSEEGRLLWGNAFAEYAILPGLFLKANYGITAIEQEYSQTYEYDSPTDSMRVRSASKNYAAVSTTLMEATLSYCKSWQQHIITIMSGFANQEFKNKNKEEISINLDMGNLPNSGRSSNESGSGWVAYFGSLQYSFANRYFLSASLRKDGSSHFARQQKYVVLPTVAAAWQVINKNQSNKFVHYLKLRTSYGLTAQASLPYLPNQNQNTTYNIDPEAAPEKTTQLNIGTDLAFLSNRVQLSLDTYERYTKNVLVFITLPTSRGFSYALQNAAAIRNRGLEVSLTSNNLRGPLTWNSAVTFASNQNRVTNLESLSHGGRNFKFGETVTGSVTSIYGHKTAGLYQHQNEIPAGLAALPGDIRYLDSNNNGKVDDQTIIGDAQPKFIYSLDNNFGFKAFELNIFLQGVYGNDIYNVSRNRLDFLNTYENQTSWNSSRRVLNYWRPDHTNTNQPRLNGSPYSNVPYDRHVENGSFLRVRNLTLAYNLPQKLTPRNKMLQAKVYVSGQNLFTFTKYSGYDPEVGNRLPVEQGFDNYNYPMPRTYLAGLKITW